MTPEPLVGEGDAVVDDAHEDRPGRGRPVDRPAEPGELSRHRREPALRRLEPRKRLRLAAEWPAEADGRDVALGTGRGDQVRDLGRGEGEQPVGFLAVSLEGWRARERDDKRGLAPGPPHRVSLLRRKKFPATNSWALTPWSCTSRVRRSSLPGPSCGPGGK